MTQPLTPVQELGEMRSAPGARVLGLRVTDLSLLAAGCALLVVFGHRWNTPLAAWLAPVFLIRYFRNQQRWYTTLPAVAAMAAVFVWQVSGSWHFSPLVMALFGLMKTLPFLPALYIDRAFARRTTPTMGALIFPAALVVGDLLVTWLPQIGTNFSPGTTQFSIAAVTQLAAFAGLWGVTFVTGWFASSVNNLWDCNFDLKKAARPALVFAASLSVLLLMGSLRISMLRSDAPTVRIGSITVPHVRGYWDEIKQNNPPEGAVRLGPELAALEADLFRASERAVAAGAKIVFWSEGDAVMYKDAEPAFLERARTFATAHHVYLAPGMLVLHPGKSYGENKIMMIAPDGKIVMSYEKTKTPFTTQSDGVLQVVDTPYGRISAGICADLDHATFVNQLGGKNVDILLDPAFDVKAITPFHTEVALFRAIENGFSMVRHTNEGASMAVDPYGNVLANQDFFTSKDATMISDVPTHGVTTLYGRYGNWFVVVCAAFLIAVVGRILLAARRNS
jgi:apolipoprotein N-acyltransferase